MIFAGATAVTAVADAFDDSVPFADSFAFADAVPFSDADAVVPPRRNVT
jgi:hypothetical protein